MKITFLEGYKPLVKKFTPQGVDAYPLVKKVTSHEFEVENSPAGLRERFNLIQKHANNGCGLLKGNLIRELVKESRSGLTNNEAPATTIVLDIDGVRPLDLHTEPPYDENNIRTIADYFVQWLPDCFQRSSYIVHASASLGTKPGVYSLHLEFLLRTPVPVQILKDYLTWLNFQIPEFEQELVLTATGTALRYKLDRTLADNSRIIYIGHPIFDDVEDPIPQPENRLQLIEKPEHCVDLAAELKAVDTGRLARLIKNKITYLRQSAGLPPRNEKIATARINGQMVSVVTNPDSMHMNFAYERGKFVYYNINGGDSNAYYVYKDNPTVVYNFKGEPNFLFQSADPDTYDWHIKEFGFGDSSTTQDSDTENTAEEGEDDDQDSSEKPRDVLIPLVFRDMNSDKFYNALYHVTRKQLVRADVVANEARCASWMKENNGIPPETIPSVDYLFRPDDPRSIDLTENFVNRFVPTELLLNPPQIDNKYRNTIYGEARDAVSELCPTIHKLVDSIMGSGELEYEHFVNWLAFIVQKKEKTTTTWICHGTQGTGKGVFMHKVMTPILGDRHAIMKGVGDANENFNSWMQEGLLVAMDEFNAADSKVKHFLNNKLKNYITEEKVTVREMRVDQKSMKNYCNFMFFSNDDAPMPIAIDDRRHNVAPRQNRSLRNRHPEITRNLMDRLKEETPLFAAFLAHYSVDEHLARTTLDNEAKQLMREASKSSVDQFCEAVRDGNMEYFLYILDMEATPNLNDPVLPAQRLLKNYVRDLTDEDKITTLPLGELRVLYHALVGSTQSDSVFGRTISRRGVKSHRKNMRGHKVTCVTIDWNLDEIHLDKVLEAYDIGPAPDHIRSAS